MERLKTVLMWDDDDLLWKGVTVMFAAAVLFLVVGVPILVLQKSKQDPGYTVVESGRRYQVRCYYVEDIHQSQYIWIGDTGGWDGANTEVIRVMEGDACK